MSNLIEKTSFQTDIKELQRIVIEFLERYKWEKSNQLCLLNTEDHASGDPYQGIGHIKEPGYGAFGYEEGDFRFFHPDYHNTLLGEIYSAFPFPICRMRLMRVPAKACYTFHSDGDVYRYHFGVITNRRAFFAFQEEQILKFIPADGYAYKVWVKPMHTFVNTNSDFDRIHLVLDAKV